MPDQLSAFHFLRSQWLWLGCPAVPGGTPARRRFKAVERNYRPGVAFQLACRPASSLALPPCSRDLRGDRASSDWAGRPHFWTRERPPFTEDKAPLVIALDLSPGMDAIDVQPTRLERAKLKIRDLMKIREGSVLPSLSTPQLHTWFFR